MIPKNEYERIIKKLRKDLKKCRKTYPNAQVIASHDLCCAYNPVYQTYRNVPDEEQQGWFVYVCSCPGKIYKNRRRRIIASVNVIPQVVFIISK